MLTELEERIRQDLITFVQLGDPRHSLVRYGTLAKKHAIRFKTRAEQKNSGLFRMLDNISRYEHAHERPLLSVIVTGPKGMPGAKFFKLTKELGRQNGESNTKFARRERALLFGHWQKGAKLDA